MASRRAAAYGANVIASVIIVLAIFVVVNFISSLYFARADLTEDKEFTVSDATKQILSGLEDLVTIKVYFSKKLPPYLMNMRRRVNDLLEEYKAYSGGKVQFEFIDPADDPSLKQKMQFMGIPPVQLNVIEKDKAQVMTAYLGIAILYENKREVIPVVRNTENLEYQLTSGISKVTMKEVKTVGLLCLGDNFRAEENFTRLRQALEKQYDVRDVSIEDGRRISKTIDTLIVLGAKELSDWEKFQIDQAIMRGARVIFMVDMVEREKGKLLARPAKTNLNELVEQYGIRVNKNLVLDKRAATASFSSGFMAFMLPYPFWIKVGRDGLSRDNPAVNQLSYCIFPWTSSVDVLNNDNSQIKYDVLARSSQASWVQTGRFDLSPQQQFVRSSAKSYDLAVEAAGKFKSAFAGKEAPKPEGKASRWANKDEKVKEESPETKIVVIGGSSMVNDEFLTRYRKNDLFLLNLVDVLTLGRGLVGIRTRGVRDRPLEQLSEHMKATIKYLNTIGVPFLVVAFGLIRFYVRRKTKRAL